MKRTSFKVKNSLQEYFLLTLGTLLISCGIYLFKFPNNFNTGGVSGISVILGALVENIPMSTFTFVINMFLLLVGFVVIGKDFGAKTVYCSTLMSVAIYLFEKIYPMDAPLTTQPLLELVISVILPGIGNAILFNYGASTGGTDVIAMIIKKYSNLNISKALLCADCVIVLSCAFVFNAEIFLMSLLGFLAKVFAVNGFIENMNTSKYFTIVTNVDAGEKVTKFITENLHKGATVSKSFEGAFMNDKKTVILTVLKRSQAIALKKYIKQVDKHAFMVISNTSDVIGKGFRECV